MQRFLKFRSQFKWKGPFRFLLTGIFGIISGGGPHISVGIFQPNFAVPFLTNRLFALIREFGKIIENDNSHSYWLARFNRPFVRCGHVVRNKLWWDANNAVGLTKQRNSYQSSPTFHCFGSPTALFASWHNLFRTMWQDPAKGLLLALLLSNNICKDCGWFP